MHVNTMRMGEMESKIIALERELASVDRSVDREQSETISKLEDHIANLEHQIFRSQLQSTQVHQHLH